MIWDLIKDPFRDAITITVTGLVIYLKSFIKSHFPKVKKFINIVPAVDELKENDSLNASYRRAMWDVLKDPLFTTNSKGEVTYVNSAYAKVMGLSDPKDVFGFNFMMLIPDEDKDKIEKQGKRLVEHPGTFEGIVRFVNQQNGKIITTECKTSLIFNSKNEWQGNLGRLYILKIDDPK